MEHHLIDKVRGMTSCNVIHCMTPYYRDERSGTFYQVTIYSISHSIVWYLLTYSNNDNYYDPDFDNFDDDYIDDDVDDDDGDDDSNDDFNDNDDNADKKKN